MNIKNFFITLSIIFTITHANDDMSGYVQSIIDFETPHNPYSGEIKIVDYKFSDEKTVIEIDDKHNYGFDNLPKECFSSTPPLHCYIQHSFSEQYCSEHPNICKYKTQETDHKIPAVYISVKKGEDVKFTPKFSKNLYKKYCLVGYNYNEEKDKREIIDRNEIKPNTSHTITKEKIEKDGIFKIYPSKSNRCAEPKAGDPTNIAIKVLPYSEDTKKFVYIQFDGGETDIHLNKDFPNALTRKKAEDYVTSIFKQAVLKAKAIDGNKLLEDAGVYIQNDLFEINMTNQRESRAKLRKILQTILEALNINKNMERDSEKWHIAIVLNKVRKKWHLENCKSTDDKDKKIKLRYCKDFRPPENDNATYYYQEYIGPIPLTPKKVKITSIPLLFEYKSSGNKYGLIHHRSGIMYKEYFMYDEAEGKIIEPEDGDELYTDNGYPVIPSTETEPSKNGSTYAFSTSFSKKVQFTEDKIFYFDIFDDYLPFGSITVTPRGIGASGLNAFVHELAHSFGLTDVYTSVIDVNPSTMQTETAIIDPTSQTEIEYDPDLKTKDDWSLFKNDYATTETNLMNYLMPAGSKIRYRNMPITCTGGMEYWVKKNPEDKGSVFAQGPLKLVTYGKTNGNGENQWECLRDCHRSEFSTYNRNQFWITNDDDFKKKFDGKTNTCLDKLQKKKTNLLNVYISEYINRPKDLARILDPELLYYYYYYGEDEDFDETFKKLLPYYTLNQLKDFNIEDLYNFEYFKLEDFENCYDPATQKKCFEAEKLDLIKKKEE